MAACLTKYDSPALSKTVVTCCVVEIRLMQDTKTLIELKSCPSAQWKVSNFVATIKLSLSLAVLSSLLLS